MYTFIVMKKEFGFFTFKKKPWRYIVKNVHIKNNLISGEFMSPSLKSWYPGAVPLYQINYYKEFECSKIF
jgi:hypothetical protein